MIRRLFKCVVSRYLTLILLATGGLSACTTEEPARQERPRPVKVETMSAQPKSGLWLVGTVKTQRQVDLAFEVGGVVQSVSIRPGQKVKNGAILAQLDREPSRLKLAQAQAKLRVQQTLLGHTRKQLVRSHRLFAEKSLSWKAVEQAESDYQSALAQCAAEEVLVSLAKREHATSQLIAPFDGHVLSYAAEPHAQVSAGQVFIKMVPAGPQDVITQIPVDLAKGLYVGSEATASTSNSNSPLRLKLQSLAPEAKEGVMQEAKFEIISPDVWLIDGTSLSLQLIRKAPTLMTLPQQAVRGEPKGEGAEVFVYNPRTHRVAVRSVQLAGLEGDRLVVRDGLIQGDQVVTAGTAFLNDQQVVTLFKPTADSDSE